MTIADLFSIFIFRLLIPVYQVKGKHKHDVKSAYNYTSYYTLHLLNDPYVSMSLCEQRCLM